MAARHVVRIEYCVPRSARPNAVGQAARKGGIFDVHVDGELVFTKSMIGRYPDPDDVLPLVRARLQNA
jgi:predicted Rdx family selenoprotein